MFKKRRRYPIKRDEQGLSLRARCFQLFRAGKRPAEVSRELRAKMKTVLAYYDQWKRQPRNMELDYPAFRAWLKHNPEFKQKTATVLARELGISENEAVERLEKPWATKQAMRGIFREEKRNRDEQLRLEATRLIVLLEKSGVPLPMIIERLQDLIREQKRWKDMRI